MITIGITGGVGAGKSTVLDFLEEKYQAYVMKADEIGHLVMEPGQVCYEPVIALFGKQVIKNDKTIDRRQISDVVFSHPELLEKLNQIIHPPTIILNRRCPFGLQLYCNDAMSFDHGKKAANFQIPQLL